MEQAAQALEAELEARHWWFRGRRRLLARLLAEIDLPEQARVLDVGSGTGANLRLLSKLGLGQAIGIDRSETALRSCLRKGLGPVQRGDACRLPFPDGTFDLILAADVIEHLDDDDGALRELRRALRPGATLIVTVPAFNCLWGVQDEVSHHRRRYHRRRLEEQLNAAGLEVVESFYFNYLLFVPIWLTRKIVRWLDVDLVSENELNTTALNRLLLGIFTLDVSTARQLRPPFGVSILARARRIGPSTGN